jgi:hypothetical protein
VPGAYREDAQTDFGPRGEVGELAKIGVRSKQDEAIVCLPAAHAETRVFNRS